MTTVPSKKTKHLPYLSFQTLEPFTLFPPHMLQTANKDTTSNKPSSLEKRRGGRREAGGGRRDAEF